jgi:phosphoribosylformimino-5-aminoimidazole carboxamide ribotide isomerase
MRPERITLGVFDIIPAIDIIDWKVVRLTKWNYENKTFYEKSVLEVVEYLENIWIKNLHLVDLIWAKEWKIKELNLVKLISEKTNLDIGFGWWIREESEIKKLLDLGVKYINIWSLAVKNKKLMIEFIKKFWANNFSIWIDVIWNYCYTNWWKIKSDSTYTEILKFYSKLGVKRFNITSIENDWMLSWINLNFYKKIILEFPQLEIIASGWVKDEQDIINAKKIWCAWIIIGKAFYEGKVNLENLI